MTTTRDAPPVPDPLDWPGYWFARLEESLHAGDFEAAAGAARHLCLGASVAYPRPMLTPSRPEPHHPEVRTCPR